MIATHRHPLLVWLLAALFLAGCAAPGTRPSREYATELTHIERLLKSARSTRLHPLKQAGLYLDTADAALTLAVRRGEKGQRNQRAIGVYNASCAELTLLLEKNPNLWHPQKGFISIASKANYALEIENPRNNREVWSPLPFTGFELPQKINRKGFQQNVIRPGYGGALVGLLKTGEERTSKDPFAYKVGRTAPVTATLSFAPGKGGTRKATLVLNNPIYRDTAPLSKADKLPLAADFTAPYAWYPRRSELIAGFMAMIRMEEYLGFTGLYMLQPYDPNRIPVLFVHGLASTPQMWLNDINELTADPELRKRYQFWVYWYPTGAPIAYSAFRLRQDLAAVEAKYGLDKGLVVVGHSMGGILSRMQSTDSGRAIWDATFQKSAEKLYLRLPANNSVKSAIVFNANPKVERLIFICTPHRGSEMALTSIGALGTRLISIPMALVDGLKDTLGSSLDLITGGKGIGNLTSIQGLSPQNPLLVSMAPLAIRAPHHSIIGDRGRGDTPNSSDGVVPYWSSHLDSAQSELIVPGPHGSFQLPQTVKELKRILHLHLDKKAL